jgi:hypothetical protein
VESKVFSLFQISLENFFKTKFYLGINLRLQPSEIDNLDYYEYHYYVQNLKDHLDKKNKAQREQQEGADDKMSKYKSGMNMNKYQNVKAPSMPNISMPKI